MLQSTEVPPTVVALPFDEDYYLTRYPDVRASGIPALAHFRLFGWKEGRNPHPDVDVEAYTAARSLLPWEPLEASYARILEASASMAKRPVVIEKSSSVSSAISLPCNGLLPRSDLAAFSELIAAAKLVTFDIWDTLLQRTVHPDHAKLLGAEKLKAVAAPLLDEHSAWVLMARRMAVEGKLALEPTCDVCAKNGSVHEYTHDEVIRAWLNDLGITEDPAWVRQILEAELEFEGRTTYSRPEGVQLLSQCLQAGKAVALVSDTYYTGEALRVLLTPWLGPPTAALRIVASSDHDDSKRHGELLHAVRDSFNVRARDHVHVGDSADADVVPQESAGGRAWQLTPPEHAFPITPLVATSALLQGYRRDAAALGAGRRLQAERAAASAPGTSVDDFLASAVSQLYWEGHRLGPAVAALLSACEQDASARDDGVIFAISREGALLREAHEAAVMAGELPRRRVVHLEVSRLSTFLPSLDLETPSELMRIWGQYSVQSPRQFCTSLGLDIPSFRAAFEAHDLSWDTPVTYPWQDPRFMRTVQGLKPQLSQHVAEARSALRNYLLSREVPLAGEGHVLDVGWRGTIQDNLSWATGTRFSGTYLGLFEFLNRQPPGRKAGVAFDENMTRPATERIRRAVSPIERLITPPLPSVVGYEPSGVPVRQEDPPGSPAVSMGLTTFQHGVIEGTIDALAIFRRTSSSVADRGVAALLTMDDFLGSPSAPLAALYASLVHDETFGAGGLGVSETSFGTWHEAASSLTLRPRKV